MPVCSGDVQGKRDILKLLQGAHNCRLRYQKAPMCLQIAAQSSDEEEMYAPVGGTGDGQNTAGTGAESDALDAQVTLLS